MGERIALDYTHGGGDPIPCDTWSGIDVNRVADLALTFVDDAENVVTDRTSLVQLASLVDIVLPDELREIVQDALGRDLLAGDRIC